MRRQYPARFVVIVATTSLALMLAIHPVTALAAGRDRTPPTTPTNLRVTATTSYSVSLAWNASTDNSGNFSYVICCGGTNSATVSQPATSFVFTAGMEAGRSYSFRIYAVDAAGNKSNYSNSVAVTLPADTTPPAKPIVSLTGTGSTYVSLAWSSTDDGPNVWYWVFKDGATIIQGTRDTAATIGLLEPETTYQFTVQARDFASNWSPLSDPITVSTAPNNPNDTTPPTTPSNLTTNGMVFQDGETWLFWGQSTDNVDPQSVIRYDVYVNGVLDHSLVGADRTILYGTPGIDNTFEVVAVDTAGNRSPAAVLTVHIP